MKLQINGEALQVASATLAALIDELGFEAGAVATAVDGHFVPQTGRGAYALREDMVVDIVAPVQGG
ncbi:sulfur carrier protein ThiS [Parahaliea mediterranea]|uniref:sulfur carrier protein ThiS n=1 Tax=Parahaliea mediterranea TaxID=651086 RepID=UPI000E2EC861|nr:sulfur carrier protein ThiS [Parahaliea mediterranea]